MTPPPLLPTTKEAFMAINKQKSSEDILVGRELGLRIAAAANKRDLSLQF